MAADKSPFQLFRQRRGYLSVTDLTAAHWCLSQYDYSLRLGKPAPTAAMITGTERHLALETEIHERVDVFVRNGNEEWAVRWMNVIAGIHELKTSGKCREFDVIGMCADFVVVGVIDLLEHNEQDGLLYLCDTKTRVRKSLPPKHQTKSGRLQLALYHRILKHMQNGTLRPQLDFIINKLNLTNALSASFIANVMPLGWHQDWHTVADVARAALTSVEQLDINLSNQVSLVYEHQESGDALGSIIFQIDDIDVEQETIRARQYWSGDIVEPEGVVNIEEAWKCCRCDFADVCSWRARRAAELATKAWATN